MGKTIPSKIEKSPLIASTAEIRLGNTIASSVLLGKVYPTLQADYSDITTLPTASLPDEVVKGNTNLVHLPHYQLKTPGNPYSVHLGPRVITFGAEPHLRSGDMMGELLLILQRIVGFGLLEHVERIGLRFINLFEGRSLADCVDLAVNLDSTDQSRYITNIRLQIPREPFKIGLICAEEATVHKNGPPGLLSSHSQDANDTKTGAVLDIDVSSTTLPSPNTSDYPQQLAMMFQTAHGIAKETFFSSLRSEFLESLGPRDE